MFDKKIPEKFHWEESYYLKEKGGVRIKDIKKANLVIVIYFIAVIIICVFLLKNIW
jgi:aminopeptidase-like protein